MTTVSVWQGSRWHLLGCIQLSIHDQYTTIPCSIHLQDISNTSYLHQTSFWNTSIDIDRCVIHSQYTPGGRPLQALKGVGSSQPCEPGPGQQTARVNILIDRCMQPPAQLDAGTDVQGWGPTTSPGSRANAPESAQTWYFAGWTLVWPGQSVSRICRVALGSESSWRGMGYNTDTLFCVPQNPVHVKSIYLLAWVWAVQQTAQHTIAMRSSLAAPHFLMHKIYTRKMLTIPTALVAAFHVMEALRVAHIEMWNRNFWWSNGWVCTTQSWRRDWHMSYIGLSALIK